MIAPTESPTATDGPHPDGPHSDDPHSDDPHPDNTVINVRDLRKIYRSGIVFRSHFEALKGVSLTIRPGEVFGLLGPNGAGKTTLIKTLLGIIRPTSGNASVLNKPAGSMAARMRIGYLPENLNISRILTGVEALRFYARLNRVPDSVIRERQDSVLEQVGLLGREKERVGGYSKGMRQRLGLAQAMIHDPDILVMDEPTDGLDPVGRSDIRKIINRLKDEGKTVFLNSHILQEVELVCDRVAILAGGVVRGVGTMEELTTQMLSVDDQKSIRIQFELIGSQPAIESIILRHAQVDDMSQLPSGWSIETKTAGSQAGGQAVTFANVYVPDQQHIDNLVDAFRDSNVSLSGLSFTRPKLEDVFFSVVASANQTSNTFSQQPIVTAPETVQ